jgi:gas vesicle protein
MTKQTPLMEDEDEHRAGAARPFAAGLVIGALMGAGVALLFAPQSGADTRRMIRRRSRKIADGAQDRFEDVKHRIRAARRKADDAQDD